MVKRSATAVWQGGLKDGKGRISTESGAVKDVAYNFGMRFESERGTNPEELIAAALASCFSMKLSGVLGEKNWKAERIDTHATTTFEKTAKGWNVTEIHLDLTAKVPGADAAGFQQVAETAKRDCPISQLLSPGTKITLTAKLA